MFASKFNKAKHALMRRFSDQSPPIIYMEPSPRGTVTVTYDLLRNNTIIASDNPNIVKTVRTSKCV